MWPQKTPTVGKIEGSVNRRNYNGGGPDVDYTGRPAYTGSTPDTLPEEGGDFVGEPVNSKTP